VNLIFSKAIFAPQSKNKFFHYYFKQLLDNLEETTILRLLFTGAVCSKSGTIPVYPSGTKMKKQMNLGCYLKCLPIVQNRA